MLEHTAGGATQFERKTGATYELPDHGWRQELHALGVEDDGSFSLKKGG